MVYLAGADGIFTNRPEIALVVFGRSAPQDTLVPWDRINC